jgi:hypothetical protein
LPVFTPRFAPSHRQPTFNTNLTWQILFVAFEALFQILVLISSLIFEAKTTENSMGTLFVEEDIEDVWSWPSLTKE